MDSERIDALRAKARRRIAAERELRHLEKLPLRQFATVDELFAAAMKHGATSSRPSIEEE